MAGYGDIFGGVGSLVGTGFNIFGSIQSSKQAKQQARYFEQMYGILDQRYKQQRAIQVRSNYLEQGQFQQNIINSGVDTSQGASLSYETGKQNLIQVQNEQLQQMDYEHQLQMMGVQQQIKNANQTASNYIFQAVGTGISGGLEGFGKIYSGYKDIQFQDEMLKEQQKIAISYQKMAERGFSLPSMSNMFKQNN